MEPYEEIDQPQADDTSTDLQTQNEAKPLAVTSDGEMVIGGFVFTATALVPKDPDAPPNFEDWDSVGQYLRYIHTGTQFWLGDWINYGESNYGEKYAQAVDQTGYDLSTLQSYAWVSRQVPRSNRNEGVAFGHYVNGIAALNPDEQAKWVQKVVEDKLTQAQLKAQLAEARAKKDNRPVDLWLVVLCKSQADFDKLEKQMRDQGREVTSRVTPQKKVKAEKKPKLVKGKKKGGPVTQKPVEQPVARSKAGNHPKLGETPFSKAQIEKAGVDEFWIDPPANETPEQKKKRLKKINNARFRALQKKNGSK
jgi:hypothetical protein